MPQSRLVRATRYSATTVAALLALTAAACPGDEATGPSTNSAAGAYVLASIVQDGEACTVSSSGCTIENSGSSVITVTSGNLNLATDGTFTLSANGTEDGTAGLLGGGAGTWAQTSSGVSLASPLTPVALAGTWASGSSSQLVFALPGAIFGSSGGAVTVTFNKTGTP
jgi:hypothetical protein